jgi:L-ascorbate metabolism protein UlaG (beta-lactamase superfamily)
MRVTLVNHATVLLQVDGVNILTDPTWARRDIPWLGSWRRRPPGLLFEELPQIDVVLVSHDHHDHMDLPTLRRLRAGFQPQIFCGLGNASYLARHRIPGARDLDWWESAEVAPGVTVTAVPARHLSGRGMFDQNRTLWCGFVVEGPSGAAYFAGDTGPGSHFAQIRERFPALRLALLPIGASEPAWYMRPKHMGPRDVLPAARDLAAATIVPIHFGTFPQGDEGMSSPAQGLRAAIAEAPEPRPRIVILENGQSLEVPEVSAEAASRRAANAAPASLRARSGRD